MDSEYSEEMEDLYMPSRYKRIVSLLVIKVCCITILAPNNKMLRKYRHWLIDTDRQRVFLISLIIVWNY